MVTSSVTETTMETMTGMRLSNWKGTGKMKETMT
jgi:hypothetical protein